MTPPAESVEWIPDPWVATLGEFLLPTEEGKVSTSETRKEAVKGVDFSADTSALSHARLRAGSQPNATRLQQHSTQMLASVFWSVPPSSSLKFDSGHPPARRAAIAVTLCGVCAFLQIYCTQPLLPLITRIFHASKTGAGLTVSATTLGVALSAPLFGALAERLPRKRVIVASLLALAVPSLLAASSESLTQLVFWRLLQGFAVPGVIAVVVTYIGEEWPPEKVALVMSFYVSGTALGGFLGRITAGLLAEWFNWRIGFLALGIAGILGGAAVAAWLPHGRRRPHAPPLGQGALAALPGQARLLLGHRPLAATFAVGFSVLFSLVGIFTWITFHLSAPPFNLSTAALSYLFVVYLIGLVVTPAAGYLISRIGLRTGIIGAIACSLLGALFTLASSLVFVIVGLSLLASGVFIAQTAAQSFLRIASPAQARVTAAGIYLTCYYLGGTAAGVVPGFFWNLGKWPACVAFIVFTQIIALAIALLGWRTTDIAPAQAA